MSKTPFTRRQALAGLGSLAAASPLLQAQQAPKLIGEPPGRIAPREELVNTLEFEAAAQRKLGEANYRAVAGSHRAPFDRITFRPRLMIPALGLDLTTELFGEKMFAPILVGPSGHQQRFHPDGELAMARGASAAKAVMVVSSRSSAPLDQIVAQAKTTLWYQVYPEADISATKGRIQQAVKAGCKAVCITIGTPYEPAGAGGPPNPAKLQALGNPGLDWSVIDQLRQGVTVPVLLKGVMSPDEAKTAADKGVQGIVVSNHGGHFTTGLAAPIEVLPGIADAVGGRIAVLADSGFRRGTDILKALSLGAKAVMVTRPALWGLAAYGAEGVQSVMEMLQTELGRNMAMCGTPKIEMITRAAVKIHRA